MSAADPHSEFADALHAAGLRLSGSPVMDGEWHRAPVDGDRGWKKSGRYRGYLDGRPAGFIQNFKTGYAGPWVSEREMPMLSAEERARFSRDREARTVERAHSEARAERKAYAQWQAAVPVTDHPYLARKGVASHGFRQDMRGRLLVPAFDVTGWLGSVQTIAPDGFKLFPKGGRKVGLFCPMGDLQGPRPLLIAEGYATAATLHEATGLPCVAAFDSGNLLPVAMALRDRHPARRMVVAGDDDHTLPLRTPPLPNVGAEKAREAAEAIGAARRCCCRNSRRTILARQIGTITRNSTGGRRWCGGSSVPSGKPRADAGRTAWRARGLPRKDAPDDGDARPVPGRYS